MENVGKLKQNKTKQYLIWRTGAWAAWSSTATTAPERRPGVKNKSFMLNISSKFTLYGDQSSIHFMEDWKDKKEFKRLVRKHGYEDKQSYLREAIKSLLFWRVSFVSCISFIIFASISFYNKIMSNDEILWKYIIPPYFSILSSVGFVSQTKASSKLLELRRFSWTIPPDSLMELEATFFLHFFLWFSPLFLSPFSCLCPVSCLHLFHLPSYFCPIPWPRTICLHHRQRISKLHLQSKTRTKWTQQSLLSVKIVLPLCRLSFVLLL